MESLILRAALSPETFNADAGTVEAVASAFAPVGRRDARGPYLERLDPEGLDTSALIGLPVLDGHRQGGARDVVGSIIAARMEGGKLVVTIRRTSATDADPVWARVADGTLRGVSIGYGVQSWRETTEGGQRVKTGRPVIREVSIVAIPADPLSIIRQEENTMPKDTQTTEPTDRAALIARVRAAHNLPEEWATRMAEAGDEITDDEVREDGRETALAARQARRTAPTIRTTTPAADHPAQIITRQAEALAAHMSGTLPSEAARPFMAMGLHDFARDALARAGISTRGMGTEEMLTRAMHGTSDFPELLLGAGNRTLAAAYQVAQSPLKTIARQSSATDFRAKSILKLGEFSGLQKVSEHGEIKAMTTGEAKEGYALDTAAGTFALSRKALVNDDLGAFGRWGEMMGRAAAEYEAAQLLALLLQSSGAGPVMGEDGVRLFHANHGNLAGTGAAPSETTLSAARLALRTQKGLDGKTPVNVVPKYLLVGPALETVAEKLLASIYATTTDDVQPIRLSLLVEPRLTGNAWYVFADPASAPVLEYAYLASAPGPQLSSRDGWETLGREFRVVLDFGCGAVDWRGAYRNAGA